LLFLARPSAPKELKVVDVSRSTVQLSWEPPEDDGGSPVIDYIIEKREVSRKTWIKVSSFFIIPFVFAVLFPYVLLNFVS